MSLNNPPRLAIVGATGAVGEVLLEILEERQFPVASLLPLASQRSAGSTVRFAGHELKVQEATPEAFEGVDLVFFAATGSLSAKLAPEAVQRGAVVVDKSNTFRSDPEVPLVVPEINAEALETHRGIVACPNCTTIGVLMAVEPIRQAAGLRSMTITTLQAASGAGRDGLNELTRQNESLSSGGQSQHRVFPKQLANNVLPLCEAFAENGYATEEMKLVSESRKILSLPDLPISITCLRVPVSVGHSATVLLETDTPLAPSEAQRAVQNFPGVRLVDVPEEMTFPTPLDVAGQDAVLVGRIRQDLASEKLWLFESSDNLRKGAALNAVQIGEELIFRDLLRKGKRLVS